MFTIEKYQEGTKRFEEACETVLKELSKQLGCETLDLKFEAVTNYKVLVPLKVKDFKLISEPLPEKILGIWKHAVKEMNIVISASEMEDGQIIFGSRFAYEHRNGGSNGHSICTLDNKEMIFRFNDNVLTVG